MRVLPKVKEGNREGAHRIQRLVKIIHLFLSHMTNTAFPRLPLHQVGPVTLAQRERRSEVGSEVGSLLNGLEDGLIDGLLVDRAGFWEGLLL